MDDTVRGLVGGFGGADRFAGWIVAVHALYGIDFLFDFWVLSFFSELQAVVKPVRRQVPLHLASDTASAAAGAFGRIDQHSVTGHQTAPFRTLTMTSWTMQLPDNDSTLDAAKSL